MARGFSWKVLRTSCNALPPEEGRRLPHLRSDWWCCLQEPLPLNCHLSFHFSNRGGGGRERYWGLANIWVAYWSEGSVSLFLLQRGNYPPFPGKWLMIAHGSQEHISFYFTFFLLFSPPTCGQIVFSCVFWLRTLKIPGISSAPFLEGLVDFTDWLAFCYTWAIICCRWHRSFWSIKACLCHCSFSLFLSTGGKPQPRQTGKHVHKCVVTWKNRLTHMWGHGHLPWPPDIRHHGEKRSVPKPPAHSCLQQLEASQLFFVQGLESTVWFYAEEAGVLVPSHSLMTPIQHPLSAARPCPHNPYFHLHFFFLLHHSPFTLRVSP